VGVQNDQIDVPGMLREQRVEACFSEMPVPPHACVRVASSSWSKPLDRTVLDLLVRLCAGEIPSRWSRPRVDRWPTATTASTPFRQKRRMELVKTVASRGSCSRN